MYVIFTSVVLTVVAVVIVVVVVIIVVVAGVVVIVVLYCWYFQEHYNLDITQMAEGTISYDNKVKNLMKSNYSEFCFSLLWVFIVTFKTNFFINKTSFSSRKKAIFVCPLVRQFSRPNLL